MQYGPRLALTRSGLLRKSCPQAVDLAIQDTVIPERRGHVATGFDKLASSTNLAGRMAFVHKGDSPRSRT